MNHLKIIHWIIEGINSQIYGNKTENEYFLNALDGHDIIAFTETQCNDDTPIHIPGYKVDVPDKNMLKPLNILVALQFA